MKEGRIISNAIGLSLAPRVPQDFVVQLLKLHCADEGLNGLVSLAPLLNWYINTQIYKLQMGRMNTRLCHSQHM